MICYSNLLQQINKKQAWDFIKYRHLSPVRCAGYKYTQIAPACSQFDLPFESRADIKQIMKAKGEDCAAL